MPKNKKWDEPNNCQCDETRKTKRVSLNTLFFYNYEHPKKGHRPILLFRSVKVQTETFFQKGLTEFRKFFLFRVPMNP